jgi:hypothetical protein
LSLHWSYWVFLALALVAMAADGLSSYLGLRPTTDTIRLITGLAVGGGLAPLLMSLLSDTLLSERAQQRMLARGRDWLIFLGALTLAGLIDGPIGSSAGPVMPLFITLCLIATFAAIILVILGLFRRFEHRVDRATDALLPASIAVVVALIILLLLAALKTALFAWLRQ